MKDIKKTNIFSDFELFLNNKIKIFKKNNPKNLELKLILKGSYVLKKNNQINRNFNDIDICFSHNTKQSTKEKFLLFLKQEIKDSTYDENLFVFYWKNIKIEFIALENINLKFCKQIKNSDLFFLKLNFHIFQVFLSLAYIMVPVFQHNREQKILNIEKDLTKILNFNTLNLNINEKINEEFLMSQIYTSTIISFHYNYKYLPINNFLNNFKKFNFLEKILNFWDSINVNIKLKKIISNSNNFLYILSNEKENMIDFLKFPSLPGFEISIINKFLNKLDSLKDKNTYDVENINNNFILLSNQKNKILYTINSDEVGGILFNNKIYDLGKINWGSKPICIYDQNSNYLKTILSKKQNDDIFSAKKIKKINKFNLLLTKKNDFKKNEIYQILPESKFDINSKELSSRNLDNRLNLLLFYYFFITKKDFVLTTKKEVGSTPFKDVEFKNKINAFNKIINLEIFEIPDWDTEKILIKVADNFSVANMKLINEIKNFLDTYYIPYKLFFDTKSAHITEFQNFNNSITISIGANKIHSTFSKATLKNFLYLMNFIWEYES
ncbi:hypothetical protein [[Mycoplasma] collis]|uniref:hypothetical protein n=1 Tax=[Mycoplasma] collis TaxID=2127 RepID=UPI00051B277B|nr:hypothetical protein [[Mycoplasma] collis]